MCVSWHARVASAIWWVCISDGQLCSYGITVLVFDWGLSFGTYGMQLPSSLLVSCRGWGIIYHHCLALVMKGTFMWPELARGSYQRSIYPNKTREQRKFLSNTHVEENRSPCQLSFLMDSSTPANVCFKKIRQMKDTMLWWIRRKESVFRNNIIYELDVTYADWRKTRHPLFMFVTAVWKTMWETWLSKVRKMPFLFFLFFGQGSS